MHPPTLFHGWPAARRAGWRLPNVIGVVGALAGLGGGLAMALIGALLTQALDQDGWLQLKVLASLVLGAAVAEQTEAPAGSLAVGALIHLALAALLGVLFELIMRGSARLRPSHIVPEVAGLVYGMLIWLVSFFLVIPIVCPLLRQIDGPTLIIQHMVYGAITGLLYALLRPEPYASAT